VIELYCPIGLDRRTPLVDKEKLQWVIDNRPGTGGTWPTPPKKWQC
jgi:hypothetical protein